MIARTLRRALASASAPAAAAALCLSLAAGAASAAPVVWDSASGGNGNSYEVVVNTAVSWDQALGAAQAAGGHLATITSQQEQGFIQSVLASSAAPTGSYWFGLQETAVEGVYQNVTGEATTFTNWFTAEPNNASGTENVAAVLWTSDGGDPALVARRGTWNDEPLGGYPANGLPTPAQADVLRGGYLIERAATTGGGDGDGDGDGNPTAIPLPAAALTFPIGAAVVGLFYRRMRRGA